MPGQYTGSGSDVQNLFALLFRKSSKQLLIKYRWVNVPKLRILRRSLSPIKCIAMINLCLSALHTAYDLLFPVTFILTHPKAPVKRLSIVLFSRVNRSRFGH